MGEECLNCGRTYSDRYVRVFGDENGVLHACYQCVGRRSMHYGAGADSDNDGNGNVIQ